jgi:ribulose-5-phosphate 4-epimerase/fuculose-1-phosphate aldolase
MKQKGIEEKKRVELAQGCQKVYLRGMVASSGGNMSVRVEDSLLITPTGVSLGNIKPADLVKVDLMMGKTIGIGKASKELAFHLQTYLTRADIGAVVHLHPPFSVCLSCMLAKNPFPVPAMTSEYAKRIGKINFIPFALPGTPELAEAVKQVIATCDSVLLAKHGLVAVGKDLEVAINYAEQIEENAQIFILGGDRAQGLTDEELALL